MQQNIEIKLYPNYSCVVGGSTAESQSFQKTPKPGCFLKPHLRCAHILISVSTNVWIFHLILNCWQCFLLWKLRLCDVPCLPRCQERANILLPEDTCKYLGLWESCAICQFQLQNHTNIDHSHSHTNSCTSWGCAVHGACL